MISIIMPSYLGNYKNAAKNRDKKLVRAVESVINQTYESWELIVIADGCKKTVEIIQKITEIYHETRIKVLYIEKQTIWSGAVRNTGLDKCSGDYACYLDIDDAFAPDHLESIVKELGDEDWYWTDDYVWAGGKFRHRKCSIDKAGQCGTSNLIHRPALARWNTKDNYAHDWRFIQNLRRASKKYKYIRGGKYLVCHIPGRFDI